MKPCTIPKEEDGNADHGYARGKYRLAIVVRLDFVQSPGHPKVKEEQGDDKSGARLFHFLGVKPRGPRLRVQRIVITRDMLEPRLRLSVRATVCIGWLSIQQN